jgi:hypothetical protein
MPVKRSPDGFGIPKSLEDYAERYPRVLARIVQEARLETISQAAVILRDAVERRKNYSDWVLTEFGGDALRAVVKSRVSKRTR